VNELHLEAGHKLNGSFLREGLVDECLLYLAPKLLGQGAGLSNFGPLARWPTVWRCVHSRSTGWARTCASWPGGRATTFLDSLTTGRRSRPESASARGEATAAEAGSEPCENSGMFTGIITGVGRIAALHAWALHWTMAGASP
jgi:hypothetical protein